MDVLFPILPSPQQVTLAGAQFPQQPLELTNQEQTQDPTREFSRAYTEILKSYPGVSMVLDDEQASVQLFQTSTGNVATLISPEQSRTTAKELPAVAASEPHHVSIVPLSVEAAPSEPLHVPSPQLEGLVFSHPREITSKTSSTSTLLSLSDKSSTIPSVLPVRVSEQQGVLQQNAEVQTSPIRQSTPLVEKSLPNSFVAEGNIRTALPKVISEPNQSSSTGILRDAVHQEVASLPELRSSGDNRAASQIRSENRTLTGIGSPSETNDPNRHRPNTASEQPARTLRIPVSPNLFGSTSRSEGVVSGLSTPPVTAREPEGPAGFAGLNGTATNSLVAVRTPLTSIAPLRELLEGQIDRHPNLLVEGPGESGALGKGERPNLADTIIRNGTLDSNNGQGLHLGMNNFSQSQQGFQHSLAQRDPGLGIRTLEDRNPEGTPHAFQRLQLDVQLSEHQRVQIDVGVQNRQVYAGLITDQAILRNLASQFVPQLENQLAQVDMELQEFSAEVREQGDQTTENLFQESGTKPSAGRAPRDHNETHTNHSPQEDDEPGLHFVA